MTEEDIWNSIKKDLSENVYDVIESVEVASDEEVVEFLPAYAKHVKGELAKEVSDRVLFRDAKKGVIVALQFPLFSDRDTGRAADQKVGKNGSTQWWGPKLPLLNGKIITVFFPADWENKKEFGWASEKYKGYYFVYRGSMKLGYRFLDDDGYHKAIGTFIKEAKTRFKDKTISTIADLKADKSRWAEVDKVKYTFNPNQILKIIK